MCNSELKGAWVELYTWELVKHEQCNIGTHNAL